MTKYERYILEKLAAGEALDVIPKALVDGKLAKPFIYTPPHSRDSYMVDFAITPKGRKALGIP